MRRLAVPPAIRTHLAVVAGSGMMLVAGVLTGVISARWLGPEARGQYAAAVTWAAFLAVVVSVGVPQALVVDTGRFHRLTRPLMLHVAVALVLTSAAGVLLAITFQPWLDVFGVAGFGLTAAGGVAGGLASGLAQRLGSMRVYFQAARIAPAAGALVGMIFLILMDAHSPNVWLLATGAALFAAALVVLILGFPKGGERYRDWTYDAGFRATTGGALAVVLVTQAVYKIDSLIMGLIGDPHDVAYYAVGAAALAASSTLVQTSGLVAFSRLRGEPERMTWEEVRRACLQALIPAIALSGLLVWLMPLFIRVLYGDEFMPALDLARVLVLATIPMGVDFVLTHLMLLQGRVADVTKVRGTQVLIGAPAAWIISSRADLPTLAGLMGVIFLGSALSFTWMTHRRLNRSVQTLVRRP